MADNNEILLKISLDSGDVANKLQSINTSVKEIANTVKNTSNIFKDFSTFIKACVSEFKENTSSVERFTNALKGQAVGFEQVTKTINNYNNSQKSINKTFEEGSTNIDKVSNSTKNYTNTVHTLETRIKGGVQALNSQTTAIQTKTVAMQQATNVIHAQNVVIKEATQRYDNFRNVIFDLAYAFRGLVEGIKVFLGLKFTEFSREFEKNLYNMNSIALETVENFKLLKDGIIEISKENNYTGLIGLSDALYEAYSAGFKMKDALNLVKEADRGALAGLAETKDVLKSLVAVMYSFGLSADQASRLNDIFLKTVQDGIITMPQLTRYIGQASTIAPELGLHIEDVASAYVQMTRQGLNAAESTTAINAVLKTFLDPSVEASKYAKELGINLSASAFEGKNFAEVLVNISKQADTDAIGKIFGNIRAVKGFFKLVRDNGEAFIQSNKEMYGQLNNTQKALEQQTQSFDQSVTRLKNTWEIFMEYVGKTTQSVLKPLIHTITDLLKLFNELPDIVRTIVAGLIIFGTALTGLALASASALVGLRAMGVQVSANTILNSIHATSIIGMSNAYKMLGLTISATKLAMLGLAGASIYTAYEGAKAIKSNQEAIENIENAELDRDLANQKVNMYRGLIKRGKVLNAKDKIDYSRNLMTVNPIENKDLALKLSKEAKEEMEKDRKVSANKEKLTKDNLDNFLKWRENYASKEKDIDNAIAEAGAETLQKKLYKTEMKYKELIETAENFLKVKNNVSDEERKKAVKEISDLKIAKEKALQQIKDKHYQEEKERQERELKKKEDSFKKQIEGKIKIENNKLKSLESQRVTGAISEQDFLTGANQIEKNKEGIFKGGVKEARAKGLYNLAEDLETQRHNSFLKNKNEEIKINENIAKSQFDNFKFINEQDKERVSNLKKLGEVGGIKALTMELKDLEKYQKLLSISLGSAPKGSNLEKDITKELEKTKNDILFKNKEINDSIIENEFKTAQILIKKEIDKQETLKQLKLISEKEYLEGLVNIIEQEISLEKDVLLNTNEQGKKEQESKIEALENKLKIAKFNLKKDGFETTAKFNKMQFDNENKNIELLRNLQVASDSYVLKAKQDNINTYLVTLKARKQELIEAGQGVGGSVGGVLGTEEYQQLTNQIRDFEDQKLILTLQTNQKIREDEQKTFKFRLDLIGMLASATSKLGDSLSKSTNDFIGSIGIAYKTLNDIWSKGTSLYSNMEGISNKISDNETSLSNLSPRQYKDLAPKLLQENKDLKTQSDLIAIGQAVEVLSDSIGKGIEVYDKADTSLKKYNNTIKLFGDTSKQAKESQQDLIDASLEYTKALPVIGDFLYKIQRTLTDVFGITLSDKVKKDNKDIEQAYTNLARSKLSLESNNLNSKLALLEMDKKEELKKILESITNEEALNTEKFRLDLEYQEKKQKLIEDYSKKELDIEINLIKAMRGLRQESYQGKLQDLELNYNRNYNQILNSQEYADEEQRQKDLTLLKQVYSNDRNKLALEEAKKDRDIQYNLRTSEIELQQDSINKSLSLQREKFQNDIKALNDELTLGLITQSQYYEKLEALKNQNTKAVNDINKKASDEIRNVNEKNYKEELRAFESLYKDKTNKLKSELQKQYDIINEYNQKVKDLQQSREQDQALKSKRLNQFKTDLANKQGSITADFYRQNLTEFNLYADTQTQQVNNAFDFGTISEDNRRNQLTQLALQKYLYYQNLANKTVDPEEQQKYIKTRDDAQKEYYDYIFDKELEKLDIEKANAEKKKVLLEQEINNRNKIENDYINQLDARYKDSAGLYKDSFVQASRDWIAFAQQETMQKLGIEVYKTLEDVGNNIAKNNGIASKYTGSTSSNTNNTNNPYSDKLPNESIDDYITRIKKQDAQAQAVRVSSINANPYTGSVNSTSYTPSVNNPFAVAPTTQTNATDPVLRQKLLNYISANGDSAHYEQAYKLTQNMSKDELIKFADSWDIPMLANGKFINKPTFALLGEKGKEAVFNEPQMEKIYNALLNPQSISNNSSSILNVNLGAINIVAPEGSNESTIEKIVIKQFDNLANNIKRINR